MLCMFHLKAKGFLPVACEQMSASQPDSISPESGMDRANTFATLPCPRTCEPPHPRMFHVNASSRWFKQVNGEEGASDERGRVSATNQLGWKETEMRKGSAVVGRTLHKYKRDGGEREGVR